MVTSEAELEIDSRWNFWRAISSRGADRRFRDVEWRYAIARRKTNVGSSGEMSSTLPNSMVESTERRFEDRVSAGLNVGGRV